MASTWLSWRMRILLMVSSLCTGGALAQGTTLDTPACLQARTELDAALQASTQDRHANAQRLQRAREQARIVCLGGDTGLPPAAQRKTVPPPASATATPARPLVPRMAAPVVPPLPPAAPPPVALPGPRVLGPCDSTGCWETQGQRLPQAGGMTSGPNGGLCSVQGQFAVCP